MITPEESLAILDHGEYGILSTAPPDLEAYGVPLNYCLLNGHIYFHCALEGKKLENIRKNPRVSFCVVGRTELLPDQFGTRYESCIVQGTADEVSGPEKQQALEGLVRKYSADFFAEGLLYIEKLKEKSCVVRIIPETISGKAKR